MSLAPALALGGLYLLGATVALLVMCRASAPKGPDRQRADDEQARILTHRRRP